MNAIAKALGPRFDVGDRVRVIDLAKGGHVRTPDYILGRTGEVIQRCGMFLNPEDLSIGVTHGPVVALYRVKFTMEEVWHAPQRHPGDRLCIEIYDHWLEKAEEAGK